MDRPFSRAALEEGGARNEWDYVFFYGHNESAGDLAVLSNWYVLDQPFVDAQGNKFRTSEHYMMHAKAKLFGDEEMARLILKATTPRKAKQLGRRVRNFDDDVWLEHAITLVADGCTLKFKHCAQARRVLLESGNKVLAEAAPKDTVWGIGMGGDDPARLNPATWRGQNLLGEALMIVRERLRNAETDDGESVDHEEDHQLDHQLNTDGDGNEQPCNE